MSDHWDGADTRLNLSLIARMQAENQASSAWDEFSVRYGSIILQWCHSWGLQEVDAEDVRQEVLMAVSQQIADFQYDPNRSFRAWLKTIAQRAWLKIQEKRKNLHELQGSQFTQLLENAQAREDLSRRSEEAYDKGLLAFAMQRVQDRVLHQTWEAFRLTALEGLTGAEVAQCLKMPVPNVYAARSKVQKMLRRELKVLEKPTA